MEKVNDWVPGIADTDPKASSDSLKKTVHDPLDMSQYKMGKVVERPPTKTGLLLKTWGLPLALVAFMLFSVVLNFESLDQKAQYMLGLFVACIVLWITESIPNYLTSIALIVSIIMLEIVPQKAALAVLGHQIIWLNIAAFILASALVKTQLAERVALLFVVKFGKNAGSIFLSFIAVNLILSAFINATAAKAALLMPIFMVVSAVYGATGDKSNNFARNLILHNLLMINAGCNAFLTGSGANLVAASMIVGAGASLYYFDWLLAGLPITIALGIFTYIIGVKFIFPLTEEDKQPKLEGGMDSIKKALDKLGGVSGDEIKAAIIFLTVLAFWATDKLHGIHPTMIALIGCIIMLAPQTKLINWNDVDLPWHLMIFSAGAYAIGAGLKQTKIMEIAVSNLMESLGMESMSYFTLYALLTGIFIASHWIFQSKTMRTVLFIPIVIGIAEAMHYDILSLALPVALCINVCWTFPFNSKPAALLYGTNKYTMGETWKYGFWSSVFTWILMLVAGQTWLQWIGITPGLF
ncbi:DASS family sodium-coupled anion symporter [Photobacterium sp. OFAV2-7]|uniref:SLC13 family permease n=1 Tax=Photobacterium sp. OFAV2-7 TaxID=2917748 RepID=UPI001EF416A5|nr:DASS family sodium-coupled anion symporter [Photobacterium sp. OFAV2-7]MCG7584691.1 DASS family sodium-coupled anion symporter [Photobacterium sp. OFAV2-7]